MYYVQSSSANWKITISSIEVHELVQLHHLSVYYLIWPTIALGQKINHHIYWTSKCLLPHEFLLTFSGEDLYSHIISVTGTQVFLRYVYVIKMCVCCPYLCQSCLHFFTSLFKNIQISLSLWCNKIYFEFIIYARQDKVKWKMSIIWLRDIHHGWLTAEVICDLIRASCVGGASFKVIPRFEPVMTIGELYSKGFLHIRKKGATERFFIHVWKKKKRK